MKAIIKYLYGCVGETIFMFGMCLLSIIVVGIIFCGVMLGIGSMFLAYIGSDWTPFLRVPLFIGGLVIFSFFMTLLDK